MNWLRRLWYASILLGATYSCNGKEDDNFDVGNQDAIVDAGNENIVHDSGHVEDVVIRREFCNEGDLETITCGVNNSGIIQRRCVHGRWGNYSSCSSADICKNDSRIVLSCGVNERGTQVIECAEGKYNVVPCNDDDVCVDNTVEVSFCDENGLRVRECVIGVWSEYSECRENASCNDGDSEEIFCGINNRGVMGRTCENGTWSEYTICNDNDECRDDTLVELSCGMNDRGTIELTCIEGEFYTGQCSDPDFCHNGNLEIADCGLNGRGTRTRECLEGRWTQFSECEDHDNCADGEVNVSSCGMNREGHRENECINGQLREGNCNGADDVCVNGANIRIECGINNRGIIEVNCVNGVWNSVSCQDEDVCLDGLVELALCNDNSGLMRRECLNGQWSQYGNCENLGRCGEDIVIPCGINGRGELTLSCVNNVYESGECADDDVCFDGNVENVNCGLNGRGVLERRCVDGRYVNGDCDDPDVCLDGAREEEQCGLTNNGVRSRICNDGNWDDFTPCTSPICTNISSHPSLDTEPRISGDDVVFLSEMDGNAGQRTIYNYNSITKELQRVNVLNGAFIGKADIEGERIVFGDSSENGVYLFQLGGNGSEEIFHPRNWGYNGSTLSSVKLSGDYVVFTGQFFRINGPLVDVYGAVNIITLERNVREESHDFVDHYEDGLVHTKDGEVIHRNLRTLEEVNLTHTALLERNARINGRFVAYEFENLRFVILHNLENGERRNFASYSLEALGERYMILSDFRNEKRFYFYEIDTDRFEELGIPRLLGYSNFDISGNKFVFEDPNESEVYLCDFELDPVE